MKAINGCLVLKGEELKFFINYIDRLVQIQSRFLSDPDVIRVASNNADKKSDWCDTANKMIHAVNMLNEIAESDVWPKDFDKSKLTWNPDVFSADFKRMDVDRYWDIMKATDERIRRHKKEQENASSDNE
jgi:hypothetical protein